MLTMPCLSNSRATVHCWKLFVCKIILLVFLNLFLYNLTNYFDILSQDCSAEEEQRAQIVEDASETLYLA